MVSKALLVFALVAAVSGCKRKPAVTEKTEPTRPAAAVHPVDGHPRLWITEEEIPRLRARAAEPIFSRGLEPLAIEMREAMDAGEVPNRECRDGGYRSCESYAELFAFMSLIHPDQSEREDYGRRAREILMHLIDQAAKGPEEDHPIRDPAFSVDNRSRWSGEAFPLAVDWLYPRLSEADKKTIREVFLRWSEEIGQAAVTNYNHPVPVGVTNDPRLVTDRVRVRWASNNYYAAHARNLGLMAMALDPEDDPGGELRGHLDLATGAWLFVINYLLTTDARGGLGPEGIQYQQQSLSYIAELLLALETAGYADPERYGEQVALDESPFWSDAVIAYAHLLSPRRAERDWRGAGHDLAWYGDGQKYVPVDFIDMLGAIGVHAARTGNQRRLQTIRWLQKHTPPGGAESLYERVRKVSHPRSAILYFLLDPSQAPDEDPREEMPLVFHAAGIGHVYARTSWDPDATWFRYICGWIAIDHQHAEGNHFGFYRRGEWLTKKRIGYSYKDLATSQFHNTLTIQNDRPEHSDPDDYRYVLWKRGSQWTIGGASGDCQIEEKSDGDGYLYMNGDATGLYNSEYEGATDVAHASRSLLWLKPDHIVIYDRAASRSERRAKRFWLQLPRPAKVSGGRAVMETESGQRLYVTRLLPKGAALKSGSAEPLEDQVAEGEPMTAYLKIEPTPPPKQTRFLTVLQGADKNAAADPAAHVRAEGGALEGAAVANTLVLFRVAPEGLTEKTRWKVPPSVERQIVTGLEPGAGYAVAREGRTVRLRKGGEHKADAGGVLELR